METNTGLIKELIFRTSRSSGAGGQNVNKVSTKVELIFDVRYSLFFNEEQKQQILAKAGRFLKDDGLIHLTCSAERSQYLNKQKAVEKLVALIEKCLRPEKRRIQTPIPDEEKERRITEKKLQAEKKQYRRKVDL